MRMESKNDHGIGKLTRSASSTEVTLATSKNRDVSFIAFCDELRAYVEEHHLFPDKHTRLSHKIKYTRKKINEGTLEEWKRVMFAEIANARDLSIHTGGRKPKAQTV